MTTELPPPRALGGMRGASDWLAWSVAAVVISGSVFGYEFFHVSVLTIDRAILAVALLATLLAVGLGRISLPAWQRFDTAFLLFQSLLLVNLLLTDWQFRGQKPVAQFLFFYLMPGGLYAMVRLIGHQPATWQILRATFMVLGLYLAATGICELQGWSALVYPRYIIHSAETEFFGRGRGPFLNPVACGIFQTVGLACGLTLWRNATALGRAWLIVFVGLLSVGIFTTLTRSVWLAALPIVGLFAWCHLSWRGRGAVLVAAPLLLGVIVMAAGDKFNSFKRDKNVSVEDMAESVQLRPLLAVVAQKMVGDRPLLGHGLAQYPQHSKPYHFQAVQDLPLQKVLPYVQHNLFLAYAVELGLVGLGLFLMLNGLFLWQSLRLWLDPQLPNSVHQIGFVGVAVMTTYLANGLFHDVAIIPMNNQLFYLFGGLVTALTGYFYPGPKTYGPGQRADRDSTVRELNGGRPTTGAIVGTP